MTYKFFYDMAKMFNLVRESNGKGIISSPWVSIRANKEVKDKDWESRWKLPGESVMDCGWFYVDAFGKLQCIPPKPPELQKEKSEEDKKYSITIDIDTEKNNEF